MTDQNLTETNLTETNLTEINLTEIKARKPRPTGMKYKCGHCGELGHNVRKCPTLHPELAAKLFRQPASQTSMLLDQTGQPMGVERLVTLILAR